MSDKKRTRMRAALRDAVGLNWHNTVHPLKYGVGYRPNLRAYAADNRDYRGCGSILVWEVAPRQWKWSVNTRGTAKGCTAAAFDALGCLQSKYK
jgi:hypothetical protein